MKKKVFSIVIVLAIILLLALPKLDLWSNGSDKPKVGARPAGGGGGPVQVEVMKILPSRLENKVVVTGSIQANESLELKSESGGKITRIHFQEGKAVKKGELLVEVNDEEILAQLQKEKYNVKLNQDIEFRQRKLLEKDAISREEYDNVLNRLNTTKADVKLLEAQLEKTKVRAPFDGFIGLRYVSEGTLVTTSTPIATLYNISPAKVEFSIPSRYSTQVQSGQRIKFMVERDTVAFEGAVYAIEPQIELNTRTLKIRALADNVKGQLLPGQFVRVELIFGTSNNAILVPTEAVVPELNRHKVYVADHGKAREVVVETGIRTNRDMEIVSGLELGDTLITTGILQLRQGVDLQIVKMN